MRASRTPKQEFFQTLKNVTYILWLLFVIDIMVHSSKAEQDIMDHYLYSEYMKEKGPIKELKAFQSKCKIIHSSVIGMDIPFAFKRIKIFIILNPLNVLQDIRCVI